MAQRCARCLASSALVLVQPCLAQTEAEARLWRVVDHALQKHWGNQRTGYMISKRDEETIEAANTVARRAEAETSVKVRAETYGEITALGARQLARGLGLDQVGNRVGPVVFCDLGSGVGKLVVQIFLEQPAVRRVVGVELSAVRCARARAAWSALLRSGEASRLRAAAEELGKTGDSNAESEAAASSECHRACGTGLVAAVEFVEESLFTADVSEITHAYVSSLCFDDKLMAELAEKLAAEAMQLRSIASLRKFPRGLSGFSLARSLQVEMAWTPTSGGLMTYVYARNAE